MGIWFVWTIQQQRSSTGEAQAKNVAPWRRSCMGGASPRRGFARPKQNGTKALLIAASLTICDGPVLAQQVGDALHPMQSSTVGYDTLHCGPTIEIRNRAQAAHVDLALVLAIDVSKSISADEHRLQMSGYALAFRQRAVLDAIADGANGAIAVAVLEWANAPSPIQAVGWTLVRDGTSAEALAAAIEVLPYDPAKGTSIGSAIEFGHDLLDTAPCLALRRVIDISGDGMSMDPARLAEARAAAIGDRVTINGLPIRDTDRDLAEYYDRSVIGGPGAFLVAADSFASFDRAILKKLVLEIAGLTPDRAFRLSRN